MATSKQIADALGIVHAVAEAIHDLGEVPSGHMYAQLCGKLSINEWEAILRTLRGAKLIKVENHLITWIGPKFAK